MLKKLLVLAALPLQAVAQDNRVATKAAASARTEFAFNLGTAPDNAFDRFGSGFALRGALSLLKNQGHFQYGATIEGGTNTNDQWYLAPGVVANYRGLGTTSYWYGGAMTGYSLAGELVWNSPASHTKNYFGHGYTFGVQAGRVQQLGGRFSWSAEVGFRITQIWHRYPEQFSGPIYGPSSVSQIVISVPVTVGFRYRL